MKKFLLIFLIIVILLGGAFVGASYIFFGGIPAAIEHVTAKITGDEGAEGVDEFKALYAVSEPTKVATSYTTEIGNVTLKGSSTLTTGILNNGKKVSVLVYSYEVLQSIEAGAGDYVTPIMGEPIKGSREYVEDLGERIDGGDWDEEGVNFAPKAGSIAINLDATKIKDCVYSVKGGVRTLSFTVEAANTKAVFGDDYDIMSDASVVITANDAVITGITVSYTEPIESEDEEIVYPLAKVTISTVYTYDIENVTLVK